MNPCKATDQTLDRTLISSPIQYSTDCASKPNVYQARHYMPVIRDEETPFKLTND